MIGQANRYSFPLAVICITAIGFYLIVYSQRIVLEIEEYDMIVSLRMQYQELSHPRPRYVKGLYLTANSAANEHKRREVITLIEETELDAVVIDIKDYTGYILYDSNIQLVNELGTERPTLKHIRAIINEFKRAGIYVIARQTVFQDPALARAKPEWAIHTPDSSLWRDYKGLSWVDPTREEVWKYNLAIAKEAATFGFDELNFDYVRFPSDGNIALAQYAHGDEPKEVIMKSFFRFLESELHNKPVFTSLDLFGLVLEAHTFDLNIGQKLDGAIDHVDYIYPMMYPSHYPEGHLGFTNPAQHPYEVVRNGLEKAAVVIAGTKTKLRPWLQAFDLGAIYDGDKIRAQITAVEESNITFGWMLWNAQNRYSTDGLKVEEQPSFTQ